MIFFSEFPLDMIAANCTVKKAFHFSLCSDLTSHISVGMKIRFKDSSVPDNSDKVWNAKLYIAVMNIRKFFFFFFCLKASGCLSWSKEILSSIVASAILSVLSMFSKCQLYGGNAISLRASYYLGIWLYKDWQC